MNMSESWAELSVRKAPLQGLGVAEGGGGVVSDGGCWGRGMGGCDSHQAAGWKGIRILAISLGLWAVSWGLVLKPKI